MATPDLPSQKTSHEPTAGPMKWLFVAAATADRLGYWMQIPEQEAQTMMTLEDWRERDAELCAEIERLRVEIEQLQDMIDNRNEFIAQRGLWRELGQYLSEPHALEPKP